MPKKIYLKVLSSLGKTIRITKNYWNKIIKTKHPILRGKEDLVIQTLTNPIEIRKSLKDPQVCLYYKKINSNYICVVAKHLNGQGFIITAYLTDRIKAGEKI